MYTTYTAAQAATRCKQYYRWTENMCLQYVRQMITPAQASPFGSLPDANAAWLKAQKKVYTVNPPAGAPVYWSGGSHGHIAVSVGGGYVRSTDWPIKGQVGTVAITRISAAWGIKYRGWSRDYAGLTIRGLEATPSTPTTVPISSSIPAPANYSEATAYVVNDEALVLGIHSTSAKLYNARVWSWLYWNAGAAGRTFCVNNYRAWMAEASDLFGATSLAATRKAYAILDGAASSGASATKPGPKLLIRLGMRADVG